MDEKDEKAVKELSLRLERIEKALEAVVRRPAAEEVSAEDLKAYAKVRAAFGWEGGTCGINETSPCVLACRIPAPCRLPPIRFCDFECTCGPCMPGSFGTGGFGGGGRFGGLGG
jgi:hypothetical protein